MESFQSDSKMDGLRSRRWAELSSRLTSQLADQADVTVGARQLSPAGSSWFVSAFLEQTWGTGWKIVEIDHFFYKEKWRTQVPWFCWDFLPLAAEAGIAYLTRDWAEMARRSHAALDQDAVKGDTRGGSTWTEKCCGFSFKWLYFFIVNLLAW